MAALGSGQVGSGVGVGIGVAVWVGTAVAIVVAVAVAVDVSVGNGSGVFVGNATISIDAVGVGCVPPHAARPNKSTSRKNPRLSASYSFLSDSLLGEIFCGFCVLW